MGTVPPASLMASSLHHVFLRWSQCWGAACVSLRTVRFPMPARASLGAHQPFGGTGIKEQPLLPAVTLARVTWWQLLLWAFAAHQPPSRDGDVGCCWCSVSGDCWVESPAGTGGGSRRAGEPLLCVPGSPTPPHLLFLGVFCSFAAAAANQGAGAGGCTGSVRAALPRAHGGELAWVRSRCSRGVPHFLPPCQDVGLGGQP